MPERVTIFDLETGSPTETFAVDAMEIVKSDPRRFAYKLPADWSPKAAEVVAVTAPVAPVSTPTPAPVPAEADPATEPTGETAPVAPEPPPADNAHVADGATPFPEAAPTADDDTEKAALVAEAEELGIDVDGRWGIAKLKQKITTAKMAAASSPE